MRADDKRLFFLKTLNGFVRKAKDFLTGRVFEVGMSLQGAAIINALIEERFRHNISQMSIEEMYPDEDLLVAVKNANGFRPAIYVCQDAFETLTAHAIRKLLPDSLDFADEVAGELSSLFANVVAEQLRLLPLLRREVDVIISRLIARRLKPAKEFIKAFFEVESGFINIKHPDFIEAAREAMAATPAKALENAEDAEDAEDVKPPNREHSQIELIRRMLIAYFSVVKKNVCDYVPKIVLTLLVNKTLDTCEQELIAELYTPEKVEQLLVPSAELAQRAQQIATETEGLRKALKMLQSVGLPARSA